MVGVGRKVCVVQGMLDQLGPQPVTKVLVGRRTNARQRDERVEGPSFQSYPCQANFLSWGLKSLPG